MLTTDSKDGSKDMGLQGSEMRRVIPSRGRCRYQWRLATILDLSRDAVYCKLAAGRRIALRAERGGIERSDVLGIAIL